MSWYCKHNEREIGPMEERTVIAKLIDGEINSRTLVKDRFDGSYRMLLDTDFNSILGHLTSRWRYNIGALKREFIYLMVSLAVWLVPLLTYLGGLFNSEVRSFLFHYRVMGIFCFLSFAGFFSTCYFTWMFAYRLWRVVPKSQYKVTPGWRIMLTFIPFFRFGWNYCMWVPLADRLRALTNYSKKTGKVAAYFYSTCVIILSCSIYAILILPWSYSLLDGQLHEALWENILGCILLGILLVSFVMTIVSFVVMAYKMKKAALAIIRHRYAYNICTQTKNSHFLESTLKRQRYYDKVHRWGHGLGIGGVLVGWPLLLIGIPTLVLFIVGSCRYENAKEKIANMGYPTSLVHLYKYDNVIDNALEDLRGIRKNGNIEQLDKIFAHSNLALPADWNNLVQIVDPSDISALHKVNALLKAEIEKSISRNDAKAYAANLARYNKYLLWLLSSVIPEVHSIGVQVLYDFIKIVNSDAALKLANDAAVKSELKKTSEVSKVFTADMFIIQNLLKEAEFDREELPMPLTPKGLWMHVYKYTPFVYFSKYAVWNEVSTIAASIKKSGFEQINNRMMEKYKNASFIADNTEIAKIIKVSDNCIKELKKLDDTVK